MSVAAAAGDIGVPLTGLRAEAALHRLVLDECLDDEVFAYLLLDGRPHSWEAGLWDYKRELPSTSGRGTPEQRAADQDAVAELVKDVVAFHNSYGGYIVAGVDQYAPVAVVGCPNLGAEGFTVEKLNEQLLTYTKTRITCRFRAVPTGPDGSETSIGLLVVPMRRAGDPVIKMARGAPERPKRSPAFRKNDILARIGDACVPVQADLQGLQFVCSQRRFSDAEWRTPNLENNLPTKDPHLIRFVGRAGYLLQLWGWLTERHTPVKVLTALGGTGKTSIVYEFCRQILSGPPSWLSKVVWLTAKKQAYSAVLGQWVGVTRTDFDTVNGFFGALARELGATAEEVEEAFDRAELLDLVLAGLRMFPALVVIDDVDSLELDQQADLFSTVQVLAGRAFDAGARFLLTSRLELSAGDDQRVVVGGFDEAEFAEYARMTARERGLPLDDGVLHRLHRVSLGSPVFCASILRLVSLGADINTAINQYKDRAGEDVRRFAFQRELDQLTDPQARTLFALSVLGETTQLELKQVLLVDDEQITRDLAKLREYHLFASRGDPSTGTKLEAPEPLRLMGRILRDRVRDPVRIEKECARTRSQVPKVQDKAAVAIASILALWKADEYDAALLTAQQSRKENPKSGDLSCVLGQCHLKVTPVKPEEADKAFRQAHVNGCARPELVPNWLEAKRLARDWNGIVDLTNTVPPPEIRGRSAVIAVDAMLELARQVSARGDGPRALEQMRDAMLAASRAIAQGRAGDKIVELRERCRLAAQHYVQIASAVNERPGDRIDVFNAVIDSFRCHVTETWMIHLALDDLQSWVADVERRSQRDKSAYDILARRLRDLAEVREHVEKAAPPRGKLARDITAVETGLRDKLLRFSVPS